MKRRNGNGNGGSRNTTLGVLKAILAVNERMQVEVHELRIEAQATKQVLDGHTRQLAGIHDILGEHTIRLDGLNERVDVLSDRVDGLNHRFDNFLGMSGDRLRSLEERVGRLEAHGLSHG